MDCAPPALAGPLTAPGRPVTNERSEDPGRGPPYGSAAPNSERDEAPGTTSAQHAKKNLRVYAEELS